MCVLGYLEEILEVKCCTCLSKYVKYRIDLVVGNEVLLDNRVLDTSDIDKASYVTCTRWHGTC